VIRKSRILKSFVSVGGMVLCGAILLGGCRSKGEFDQMVDHRLAYAGVGESNPKLACRFNLQTIYFSGYAIDTYLHMELINKTENPLVLNPSEDKISVVIHKERKYTVAPATSTAYRGTVKAGSKFQTKFRIHTESLTFHAQRREISSIKYELTEAGDTCLAHPK